MEAEMNEITASVEQITNKSIDATVMGLKESMGAASTGFQASQTKMKEGMEKAMKTTEQLVAFSQGNIEAFVKSSQIWTTGVQDLSKHVAAAAQASMEEGMSTFKALTGVKSLKDAFELQAAFARATLEKTVAQSGKLTDASLRLTEQAIAPITARVSVAVEQIAKAA